MADAVDINPARPCKKGVEIKFVSMADLQEFNKKIQGFTIRKFSGGSRFVNGDTLMARITPCLENGKTAFVDFLEDQEVAGGSTEFIVLSGKSGVSTNQFVYYLATSPTIRQKAIQAMSGTSGRQRVETSAFQNTIVSLPNIPEQKIIVKILGDLDAKIELNQQMNKTLESMAQALFKEWFVDFKFPGYEEAKFVDGLPEGWRRGILSDVCEIIMGQSPPGETYNESGDGLPFYQGNRDFGYRFPTARVFCSAPTRYAETGDVLISVRAPVGALNIAHERCCIGRGVAALRMKDHANGFLFYFLSTQNDLWDRFNSEGTVFGCLNKTEFNKIDLAIPSEKMLRMFDEFVIPVEKMVWENEQQIRHLSNLRDSLLPKLMSGELLNK